MRIISGYLRGRTIKVPNSKGIRPTTEKNREAIFNFLRNIFVFEEATILDIYAGSGALGFEALSQGAKKITFIEQNYQIYQNIIFNATELGVLESVEIVKSDAVKFAKRTNSQFDLILADPPFFKNDIYLVFEEIFKRNLLTENGLLIIERSIQTESEDIKVFQKEPIKKLGDSLIYKFENGD
jgi:16S rRNA (guanine(966)-N(2))-methyltransferase RsmD